MDTVFGMDIEHVCVQVLFQSYYSQKYVGNEI